ncbi:DnaJ domain-containing protein [bacterium]|nr:DnaJ domain-containing protein [bacterium]
MENCYKILNIPENANLEEIKSAYKKLVRKYHPDINKDERAEETFKKINMAFEILSDDIKRLQHDTLHGIIASARNDKKEENKEEIKEEKPKTKTQKEEIKKEESFFEKILKNKKYKKAEDFKVNGENINTIVEITGKEATQGITKKINILHSEPCPKCEGRKFANGSKCTNCGGTGEKSIHKKITITIPKNVKSGSKIKVKGEGKLGKFGGKSGDLIITIKVIQKNIFKYEGGVAILEVPITPYEALLGASITIPTPAGNTTIKIPPQTNSGDKFKILNSGIPQTGSGKRSELIVIAKICSPQKPSIETIKKYKELQELDTEDVRKELFE